MYCRGQQERARQPREGAQCQHRGAQGSVCQKRKRKRRSSCGLREGAAPSPPPHPPPPPPPPPSRPLPLYLKPLPAERPRAARPAGPRASPATLRCWHACLCCARHALLRPPRARTSYVQKYEWKSPSEGRSLLAIAPASALAARASAGARRGAACRVTGVCLFLAALCALAAGGWPHARAAPRPPLACACACCCCRRRRSQAGASGRGRARRRPTRRRLEAAVVADREALESGGAKEEPAAMTF